MRILCCFKHVVLKKKKEYTFDKPGTGAYTVFLLFKKEYFVGNMF